MTSDHIEPCPFCGGSEQRVKSSKQSVQGYIKQLIRRDIATHRND